METKEPRILKRNGKKRCGRGFSRGELKAAGTNPTEALKLGIPTDSKRKTAHEENIDAVRTIIEEKRSVSKPKGKPN